MAKVRFVKDTEAKINDAPVTDGTIYVSSDTGKMFVDNTDERDQIGIGYTLSKSGNTITLTGEDGSVSTVTDANTTYGDATTSASGLMSASDKTKLNNLDSTISAAIGEEASARQKQDQLLEQAIDDKLGADDIIAGSNVQVSHDDQSGHITISATDTKYAAGAGLTLSGTEFGIADGGIIGRYLDDNCVMERNIVVGSVTSDKIPALAITTPKLADNAVTAIKMADDAVATRSIQNGAVTADKLAEGVIPEIPKVTLASLGVTATAQELNYTDGVTSNIQTQLNGKAAASHTHDDRYYTEDEVDGLLAAKANTSHTHSAANITSGTLALDRIPTITDAKIQGMSASKLTGTIPQANLPSYVDDVLEYNGKSNFPDTGESGKIYVDTSTNKTYRWSGSGYTEISASLALGTTSSTAFRGDYGNTAYQHATAKGSAFASGLYKITTNAQGHVTAATAVTKSDITALGIPAQDTNTTYGVASSSANGLMSAADKAKLDGIASGANKTTVDSALSSTSTNPVQNKVINSALAGKASSSHTHNYAGSSSAGGSANSAVKLDSSAGSATQPVYFSGGKPVATTYTLNASVPSGAKFTDTTYSVMKGATSSAAGSTGLVPAPAAGKQTSFLRGDGTWVVPTNTNTTYDLSVSDISMGYGDSNTTIYGNSTEYTLTFTGSDGTNKKITIRDNAYKYDNATTSLDGLMSAEDKSKLNGIATGANKTIVDSALSATSTNPVQNKVIKAAIDGKAASSHTHAATQITGLTASRALVSDASGHPAVSSVTSTELGYLDGVTSAIQTQLNGKAAASHNHSAANITSGTLAIARGGTGATTAAAARTALGITPANIGAAASSHTHSYLPLSGGTLTGAVTHNAKNNRYSCSGGSWINGKTATNVPIVFSTASTIDGSRYDPYMWGQNTDGDVWNFGGGASNQVGFFGFNKGHTENGTDWSVYMNITTGKLTATAGFAGALSGNATTATTLQTARTINGTSFNGGKNITTANWGTARTLTIGNTGKSVNGSGNVSWSLSEIGAAAANHTHSYLPLSGGTLTGTLKARAITPSADSTYDIGTSSVRYRNVYADTFTGSLSGNATTASKLATARTISLSGAVSGSASFNGSGNITINTTMPSTGVGTVEVSSSQPTNSNVILWVKP